MKLKKLRRNITANATGAAILLFFLAILIFYLIENKSRKEEEIQRIKSETIQNKSQIIELESKINEAKKYKEIYKTIDDSKKSSKGIKMDEVNSNMAELAMKYNISAQTLQALLPEKLEGQLANLKTVELLYTTGSLSFSAIDDLRAAAFIREFFSTVPGYTVITDLNLSKTKVYSNEDLVAISNGQPVAAISVKISFAWYVYKGKDKPVENKPLIPFIK